MKVLIIDDDNNIVNEVKRQLQKAGFTSVELIPESLEPVLLISQVKRICEIENFDFVLLDYELWGDTTGDDFSRTFVDLKIPFIGFSGDFNHNRLLESLGALNSISKSALYGSRGFNGDKFLERFIEIVNK